MTTALDSTVENEWMLGRLFFNLLGYASVAVPGAIIIYFLKKYKYYEGPGVFKKCLSLCVIGEEVPKASLELGGEDAKAVPRTQKQEMLLLCFCFCGLQFSYLTWGVLQEKIMTKEYLDRQENRHKFRDSQFLVFVNRVLALLFAAVYLLVTPRLGWSQPKHCAPLYKYSYCSFSNIMSSWCQYEALKYVSFPSQVLAKTSKIIPVMLMGKIISKKSFATYEYLTAAAISVGMTVFLLSRSSDNAVTEKSTTFLGVAILVGYMVFDSFTSNWQGQLFSVYHMSSVQMMCGVNMFSCLFTSVSLWQQGSFESSLAFSFVCPAFFWDCIALSFCSAAGQLFIFYTISQFGPVVFVIVMTVRQAVAIVLSCLLFQHNLSLLGMLGIAIVFIAVFLRIFLKKKGP